MCKFFKTFILFLSIIFVVSNTLIAGGLSTTFVEVRLKNIVPGRTYSVEKETGMQLVINNTTETKKVDIAIEAEKPVDYNLVPGYEPIPDLKWVVIKKNYFKDVGPNQHAYTDILIKIPRDKKFANKKYQVYIYSHTAGKETIRMGLMSRILIETAPKVLPSIVRPVD